MIHLYIQETNANISSVTYEARLENVSSVSDDSGHWNTPPELKACVYLVTVRASQRLPPPAGGALPPKRPECHEEKTTQDGFRKESFQKRRWTDGVWRWGMRK